MLNANRPRGNFDGMQWAAGVQQRLVQWQGSMAESGTESILTGFQRQGRFWHTVSKQFTAPVKSSVRL